MPYSLVTHSSLHSHQSYFPHKFSYAYNVRHAYGKEGKRQDYTPYSCRKIILGTPPASGDQHGCPFKHWDENRVRAKLGKMKVATRDIKAIMEAKKRKHQLACRRHFEVTHPKADTTNVPIGHPNEYFELSVSLVR